MGARAVHQPPPAAPTRAGHPPPPVALVPGPAGQRGLLVRAERRAAFVPARPACDKYPSDEYRSYGELPPPPSLASHPFLPTLPV